MPIVDYMLVCDSTAKRVECTIQLALQEGWELRGDPLVYGGEICQAIVKRNGVSVDERMEYSAALDREIERVRRSTSNEE